jgi:P27 family predicted phage terminase small subunit
MHRGRRNQYDDIHPAVLRPQLTSVPRAIHRQPPTHFGQEEVAIWKRVFSDYDIHTETAADVLAVTLEAHMRCREARQRIEQDGMVVNGRDGQPKPHPLLAVERDSRAQFLAGLKALGLQL